MMRAWTLLLRLGSDPVCLNLYKEILEPLARILLSFCITKQQTTLTRDDPSGPLKVDQ